MARISQPTPPGDDTPPSLLARVKQSTPGAAEQLAEWIGPFILRWCRGARLQSADVDEASQQALLKIWRGLGTFRKDRPGDSFRGWAYTITRHCVHDLLTRRRAEPCPLPPELPADASAAEAQGLKQRALQLLVRDLVALHADIRGFKAFYRTAVDGLSAVDVAEELEIHADAVRQHKARWTKRLREMLGEQFGELLD